MKVTFHGAAQTVTGSCYVIETETARFAVDCGMFQGNDALEERNYEIDNCRPRELDFVLLTHAHIDHSGLLPRLVREGFSGSIYCTTPTADLAELMLEDSAHIQETEQEWKSRHNLRKGKQDSETDMALYSTEDAQAAARLMRAVEFGETVSPAEGVSVLFRHAGHILGAAMLDITITEQGKSTRLLFSGDLGRPGALLVPDAERPPAPDWLFVESTYGDRDHKGEDDTLQELAEAINYSCSHNEKTIIPAFAVERTQEILYSIILLKKKGLIPEDVPVYVDSPMAAKATQVFIKYGSELHVPDISLEDIQRPGFKITYTKSVQDSQNLNTSSGPAIILSASGMCNAGRIRHHLRHNIWKPGASIVFVGFQAMGTPGRKLVDGAKSLRLNGEELNVAARLFTINGFSAHAGQSQLLDWIGSMANPAMHVVLIHGEPRAQQTLAELIKQKFGIEPVIPDYMEEMDIEVGKAPEFSIPASAAARKKVDWNFLMQELDMRTAQLRERITHASELPWEEQMDLRDRLAEIQREIFVLLSQS
ncbi:MAG: MBL fold metallo-hydrolase [Mailhella sp.]|nr:MBL fold metallo-hydrolase [Mailhella sp.]